MHRQSKSLSRWIAAFVAAVGVVAVGTALAAPGDLDPSFGAFAGLTTRDMGGSDFAFAVAVQPDGRVVAVGGTSRTVPPFTTLLDEAIARFNTDGSPDATFGDFGRVVTDIGGEWNAARSVVIQPDGKIVVAGQAANFSKVTLTRYNADGSLDMAFGAGGKVVDTQMRISPGVALQPDGKLVVAAGAVGPTGGVAVARYNADGTLDGGFGAGGRVVTGFTTFSAATSIALQSDGKIVAVGVGESDLVVVRYDANGSLDVTFDGDGKLTTDFGGFDGALDVAIQGDGKIVAAGWGRQGAGGSHIAVARYLADGTPDATFGNGGKVMLELADGRTGQAQGVVVQQNGKIVVAGVEGINNPSPTRPILVRFAANGTPDASFGVGGIVLARPASLTSLSDVALQRDGKLLAVGAEVFSFASFPDFAVARYLGDPTTIRVTVDVKPGSDTSPINTGANGIVPVAILATDAFDPTSVDPATVCFGDADQPTQRDCTESHGAAHVEDVNGDGRSDLLMHFDVNESGIDAGDATACLTGRTRGGIGLEGCDSIVAK